MSQKSTTPDLVELVTGLFEAADRGDWDALIRPYAPDVVIESEDGLLDAAGASEARRLWEGYVEMFEDFRIKVETVDDLGNGVVYATFRQEGRPRGSTSVATARGAFTYEWVDGMIVRVITGWATDESRASALRLAASRGQT